MAEDIKSQIVVDASFVLAFLLKERVERIDLVFEKYKDNKIALVSTEFLPYEVGNGIRTAVIRKKLTKKGAFQLYKQFLLLKITLSKVNYQKVLSTALSKNLSFYDASYLTLAKNLSAKLLTLDKVLQKT